MNHLQESARMRVETNLLTGSKIKISLFGVSYTVGQMPSGVLEVEKTDSEGTTKVVVRHKTFEVPLYGNSKSSLDAGASA